MPKIELLLNIRVEYDLNRNEFESEMTYEERSEEERKWAEIDVNEFLNYAASKSAIKEVTVISKITR